MQLEIVNERIRKFLVDHFPMVRRVSNDGDLLGNGLVDSLGILDIVVFLEGEFQITVADEELLPENFGSITRLAVFVQSKVDGALVRQLEV